MANEQTLIQWLLEQHDDPPDYTPDEALAGAEEIEEAVRTGRPVSVAVEPPGTPEGRQPVSHDPADPFRGQRVSTAPAEPFNRQPASGPSAVPDLAERFSRQSSEVTTPSRFSAEAANFIQWNRQSMSAATPVGVDRVSAPPAESVPEQRVSSPEASPAQRQVQFFIPKDFPADAHELFAIADRDIPVNEEGSFDKNTSVAQIPTRGDIIPTDELVVERHQADDFLSSREDRRVR